MKTIILILFLAILSLSGCSNNANNNSSNIPNSSNNTSASFPNNVNANNFSAEKVSVNENTTPTPTPVKKKEDEVLSTFSTKVIDKSKDRKTNVDITVSKLDGYRLEPRSNFFFLWYCRKSHSWKGL